MTPEDRERLEAIEPSHLMALTVYGEARGEPIEGKIAVAHVINNRIQDNRWPDTLIGVVLQPKQFSCWNDDDPNSKVLIRKSKQGVFYDMAFDWKECMYASHGVIARYLRDNTFGANHYHTQSVSPYWADKMQKTIEIGHHIFYRG